MSMIKFKLTNKNIALRLSLMGGGQYKKYRELSKIFCAAEQTIWRWASLNPKYNKLPDTKKCPFCGKSPADAVLEWLNDGELSKKFS